MALYMYQAAFTSDAWATLAKNPQDRTEAVRTLLQGVGGKLISYYFAFGDYDAVVLAELPDNGAAAAAAIAVAAGGAIKAVKTTPLFSAQEGVEAMRKAGQVNYRPPSRDGHTSPGDTRPAKAHIRGGRAPAPWLFPL